MIFGVRTYIKLAAGQGLEPQYHPPEGCVLPLDEPAIFYPAHPNYTLSALTKYFADSL